MALIHNLLLHASLVLMMMMVSAAATFPTANPNSSDSCGDVAIPFPFGTTQHCYKSNEFWVTCNHAFNPPKLFAQNSTVQIKSISLEGQIRVFQNVSRDCYARNGSRLHSRITLVGVGRYFTVNNTANKITMVGCDGEAVVSGWRHDGGEFRTGCSAMCGKVADATEGSCTGLGCCQTSIPRDVRTVMVQLRSYYNYTNVSDFNNCSYGFVVENTAFNFSRNNLSSFNDVERLPMVVDWAIGNSTCEEAEANSTTYACVAPNSTCFKPENGYGYRCRCPAGYEGNPYLKNGCQDMNECEVPDIVSKCKYKCENIEGGFKCVCPKGYHGDGKKDGEGCTRDQSLVLTLVAGIALGIIVLLLAAILLHLELKRRRSKREKKKFFLQNGGMLLQEKMITRRERTPDTVKIFTTSELQTATNNFHNSMIIGQGGFGTVYKGVLLDNRIVAIKKSKGVDPNQTEQFINEVFVLSQVNHRNIVRLIGCCLETQVPHLVYEFINNRTLSAHLHNHARARFLNWGMRLKIAAETAGVLAYLHSAASTPIIHRDVKSDNILLDHTFTTKVADFGASRLVPLDQAELSTMVQGTFGYLDPEYLQNHQLTDKSDVYSFGVVLAELLTGRMAISNDKPKDERNLVKFFLSVIKEDRLIEIVDDNIVGNRNMEQMSEVARLAKTCLNVRGQDRPSMKEVAMELEGLILGAKHSWDKNADINVEEMNSLLGEDGNLGRIVGEGSNIKIGYDSLRGHVLSPVSGGR